jgi:signal transduction histidine kinase
MRVGPTISPEGTELPAADAPSATATPSAPPHDSPRIFGDGEMADLIRNFDWSSTSLGPFELWPDSLFALINTILNSRHPMLLMWGDELIQFYNDAFRPSISGDKHPRALGQKASDCWTEIWHVVGPQLTSVVTRGESIWFADTLVPILRDGRLDDVYWTYGYSPARDEHGQIRGALVVCTDTTASVKARQQLQRESQRMADIFVQAPAFFAVLDGPEFVFEMLNPLYQNLIGPRTVVGRPVAEAIPEAAQQGYLDILRRVYSTGEPYVGHNVPIELERHKTTQREVRYLNFVYQPRRGPAGEVTGIIVVGVDVTEGRRAEQLLVQSEKLVAVGRLASSIAHEINNPLEAVTNLLYLAQLANSDPSVADLLSSAESQLRRVSAIASQTLRFHRQSTHSRAIAAKQLVDETMLLYQGRVVTSRIQVERRDTGSRPISCLEGEIRQVLSNLIGNALDAIQHDRRLFIRTRDATHLPTGRKGVVFTVADTGAGMTADTLARMFEPFFSTKGINGTGLGMWVSREIIERHEGVLTVRSTRKRPHSGSVFRLFLPQEPRLPSHPASPPHNLSS